MNQTAKSIVFGWLVAFFIVLLVEFVMRWTLPFPLTTIGTYEVSDQTVYFHRPNSSGYETSPLNEYPPIRLHYNQFGFRGDWQEFPKDKSRAFVLGDSYVEARQVPVEKTAVELLNGLQRSEFFANAGCSAFTTTLSFLLLKNKILALGPKRIVLLFTFNDYSDNFTYGGGYYTQPGLLTGEIPRSEFQPGAYKKNSLPVRDRVISNFAILTYMNRLLVPEAKLPEGNAAPTNPKLHLDFVAVNKPDSQLDDQEKQIVNFTHEGIRAISDLARTSGAEFSMFIIPMPTQVSAEEWTIAKKHFYGLEEGYFEKSRIYQDRLLNFCKTQNLHCFDMLPAFQKAEAPGVKLFNPYDGHWTERGNEIVAREIFATLSRTSP